MKDKVLFYAINIVAGIMAVIMLVSVCSDLYFLVSGEDGWSWEFDGYGVVVSATSAVMLVAGLVLMNLSVKNIRLVTPAMILMGVVIVYNFDFALLNCFILYMVWYNSKKREIELSYEKTLKISVILACVTGATVVLLPLISAVSMSLVNPGGFVVTWMLFVFGMQIFSFILRPELVTMIYLRRQCKKDLQMDEIICKKIKKVTTIYFVVWTVILVAMLLGNVAQMGAFDKWSSNSLEAGDWSEWETE